MNKNLASKGKRKGLRQVRDSSPCTLARSRFRDGRRTTWLTWQEILEAAT